MVKSQDPTNYCQLLKKNFQAFNRVSQAGYGKTRKEVKSIAGMVAVNKREGVSPLYQTGGFKSSCKGNHIIIQKGRSYSNV